MKLTLGNVLELDQNKEKSILQLKKELINYKKRGEVFILENISTLNIDDPFTMYFYLQPSKRSIKNAFPIPLEMYLALPRDEEQRKKALIEFYEQYYNTTAQKGLFKRYSYKEYKSEGYVWLYRDF